MNRNYFGRQTESFEAELVLPFLGTNDGTGDVKPFNGIFIRAPVVESILPVLKGEQTHERAIDETVIAPSRNPEVEMSAQVLRPVEVMASLPGRGHRFGDQVAAVGLEDDAGDIVAVKQGNVFGRHDPNPGNELSSNVQSEVVKPRYITRRNPIAFAATVDIPAGVVNVTTGICSGSSSALVAHRPHTTVLCRMHLPPFDAHRRLLGRNLLVLDRIRHGTRLELGHQICLA